jgi:predicted transcriptional regulator
MARVSEDSVIRTQRSYSIFRLIARQPEGSYSTEISDELDRSQGYVSEHISKLESAGLIEKGKKGKAQYYVLNPEGAIRHMNSFFDFEVNIPEDMIVRYIRSYLRVNKKGTIKRMLREDFVSIFSAYQEVEDIPDFLQEFLDHDELEGFDKSFFDIAKHSLEEDSIFDNHEFSS